MRNPEFWLRGNESSAHEKPHWYVDMLAMNLKEKAVYLCDVTFAKQPRALMQRLNSWHAHWPTINKRLREDTSAPLHAASKICCFCSAGRY